MNGRSFARVVFSKRGDVRFVGHLDIARAFDRAVRRAALPVVYTEGFNPRAKISFAHPLPVGAEGEAEQCLIELAAEIAPAELANRLSEQLPEGLRVVGVELGKRGRRSPLAEITRASYRVELEPDSVDTGALTSAAQSVMQAESLPVRRRTKSTEATVDIRPGIISVEPDSGEQPALVLALRIAGEQIAKPEEVLTAVRGCNGCAEAAVKRLVRTGLG